MIRVERRIEPPPSLASRSAPFRDDVKTALDEDFDGKCYLCEGIASDSFDVEHLRPKCDFPELAFDWSNLFPAHSRCNERRKTWTAAEREPEHRRWPKGGMLDCAADDVGSRLTHRVVIDVETIVSIAATDPNDKPAVNTATELATIYSPHSFWGRQICSLLGSRYVDVNKAYLKLLQLLAQYGEDWEQSAVSDQQMVVREMLSPHSPYAGLIRSKMRSWVKPGFHSLLGL